MARVKRGTTKAKHRRNVLKLAKGYRFGRRSKEKQAKEAIRHAGVHAFNHRRRKKADFRKLFTVRLNAAVRGFDMNYSNFINALKKKNVSLDRKILSKIADSHPETFERIVKEVKG
jgi:large subunit ribosomal protein L20